MKLTRPGAVLGAALAVAAAGLLPAQVEESLQAGPTEVVVPNPAHGLFVHLQAPPHLAELVPGTFFFPLGGELFRVETDAQGFIEEVAYHPAIEILDVVRGQILDGDPTEADVVAEIIFPASEPTPWGAVAQSMDEDKDDVVEVDLDIQLTLSPSRRAGPGSRVRGGISVVSPLFPLVNDLSGLLDSLVHDPFQRYNAAATKKENEHSSQYGL